MNFKKRLLTLFIILLTFIPNIVFAYSGKLLLGGQNIGIKVNSKYVMVVGFYKVDNRYIGEDSGLRVGDNIIKINDISVTSIDDMVSIINNLDDDLDIKITFLRDDIELETNLTLVEDSNHILKSGLYVKDTINGIGTISFIIPESNIFGALGHEIADKNTLKKVEIKDGKVFKSEITDITPSKKGTPGSKNAKLYTNTTYGEITKNTKTGIYGKLDNTISNELIDVASSDEVILDKAKIRTVINGNEVKEFDIDIIEIDKNDETKNLLFQIIDEDLLKETGGVVAGMSGSPIIQNNKIIGAVTHVVVNEPEKGYGIFIDNMLKEIDN